MNRNLTGGYYIVSLGGVDLLGESVSLPDIAKLLYEAKKHKFVVLQDIVMGGEKKVAIPVLFDASMTLTIEPEDWDEETDGEFVPEPIYTATIYNVYGKNIAIDAEGGASVTDYEVQADTETLYGKFVRIMNAPQSTTLTDEQIAQIEEGVFINGRFLGYKNPVLFPCEAHADGRKGLLISQNSGYHWIIPYKIVDSVISAIDNRGLRMEVRNFQLMGLTTLNGKDIPSYPSNQTDKTYALKLVNGTLTWVEEVAQ